MIMIMDTPKPGFKSQNLGLASQALHQLAWLIPLPSPSLQPTLHLPTHTHIFFPCLTTSYLRLEATPDHIGLTPTGEGTQSGTPKPVIKQEREAAAEVSLSLSGPSTTLNAFRVSFHLRLATTL